jgi:hypothetical protein
LGFSLQLGTVRFLGTFLADPLDVPWPVVEYLGRQLGIADVSVVKAYTDRAKTPLEHSWEIRQTFGYVDFAAGAPGLGSFSQARAWTRPERPSELFDQAVAHLRAERVLLPGVTLTPTRGPGRRSWSTSGSGTCAPYGRYAARRCATTRAPSEPSAPS